MKTRKHPAGRIRDALAVITVFCIAAYTSCAENTQNPGSSNSRPPNTGVVVAPPVTGAIFPTTALEVNPAAVPEPFTLKTEIIGSESGSLYARLIYPFAGTPQYAQLDTLVLSLVRSKIADYSDTVPESENPDSANPKSTNSEDETQSRTSVDVWIADTSTNGTLISFCFIDQGFTEGAAHYNHGYSTINFDIKAKKQVRLGDVFRVQTPAEKAVFLKCVNGTADENSQDIQTYPLIDETDLSRDLDFMIKNGTVFVYFDDYEKGSSMEIRSFPIERVAELLQPAFKPKT